MRKRTYMPSFLTRLVPFSALFLAISSLATPPSATGQEGGTRPNVFFDCDGRNCNSQYYRTEINWVNWVRDRNDADVHVIMTSTNTGNGGREYQLDLLGVSNEDYEDQLRFQTLPTDTDREQLDAVALSLGIAIASFASEAGFRNLVTLSATSSGDASEDQPGRLVSRDEVTDPWNLWSFRISGNANLDGEETRESMRIFSGFNASRVTPTWKLNFNGNASYNRQEFELDDGTFSDTRTDWGFNQLVVYSVADHWSFGFQGQVARMTRFNQDFRVEFTPAMEYSFFPYEEATRRSLTAFYKIGPAYRNYIERTVFGEMEETRWEQSMEIEFAQRQPWGEASFSFEVSHFLHDVERNKRSFDGDLEFRVMRGLSVNLRGDIEWVDDQIYLSARGSTDEEALLQLRQRGSDFNWGISAGFSFQFGSIYNNVVNNRFRGVGGGGFGRRF